jgi:hypothetical protein
VGRAGRAGVGSTIRLGDVDLDLDPPTSLLIMFEFVHDQLVVDHA